jgi:TatD DNase family protein
VSTWTDSHCHLQDLDEVDPALERGRAASVTRIVCVGTDATSSQRAAEIATATPASSGTAVWATIGLHPHEAKNGLEPVEALLAAHALAPGLPRVPGTVVGVGECGLDYHYDHSPRDVQREVFAGQVALANRYGLTLVVHTREAWDDTFAVLEAEGIPERTIIHCFTGGPVEARRCLDVGAYLSFSGIVTFKGAPEVREAADLCPLDKMLVETDAPFLAPVPHRGRPNEPAFVAVVGEALAALKGCETHEFAAATSATAAAVFGLATDGA